MKIQTTVEQRIEKEITLPYFCKVGSRFIGIYDEKRAFTVFTGGYQGVNMCHSGLLMVELGGATPATENEFLKAYNDTIASMCIHDEVVYENAAEDAERHEKWTSDQAEYENQRLAS